MPKTRYTKRSDGRYQVKIGVGKSLEGKTIYKTLYAATERELRAKEDALKLQLSQGVYVDNATQTLAQWAREWLMTYKNNVSYNTYAMYSNIVEKHLAVSDIASVPLKDIKLFHLQQLINQKAAAGLTRTLELLKCTLDQIFDAAINNDMLLKNPTRGLELPKREHKEKRALTPDERTAIEKADFTPKQRAFVYLGLYAGLRRGEILALTTDDIDLENRIIRVNKNLVINNAYTEIKASPKTDAGFRDVMIRQRLYDVLAEYIASKPPGQLFTMNNGNIMTSSSYTKFWKGIVNAISASAASNGLSIDIETLSSHILRHTCATDMFYSGLDLKTAQRQLGHSRADTTLNIYTHCQTSNAEALDKMNNYDKRTS